MSAAKIASAQDIIDRILEISTVKQRLIVAIDGLAGAGKSSLARAIVSAVSEAKHVEYDWFHLPQADATQQHRFDNHRLQQDLIIPFGRGQCTFEFQRYNWGYLAGIPDGFAPDPIKLTDVNVIVLDGCGVLNPALDAHFDLKIWLDTDAKEALSRGMKRDIEEYGLNPDRVKSAWAEWTQWESQAITLDDRRRRADMLV